MICPRRDENPGPWKLPKGDTWRSDGTCSYCGSLNPETLMARLDAGDIELVPTDKNYKAYVHNRGGEAFKQTYRDCAMLEPRCKGPDECTHWVTREVQETKFYFMHLVLEQKIRFVQLHNEHKIKIGYPGHFYVLPYFMTRVPRTDEASSG